jgi:hypothetical protein
MHTDFWWENVRKRRAPGIHKHRREDNIKMQFQKVVWEGVDWIDLTQAEQGQVEADFKCGDEPSGSTKRAEFLD